MATKTKENMPELAYVIVDGEDVLCIVKRGQNGYFRTDYRLLSKTSPDEFAAQMNARLKVTPLQAEAMLNGSMFGWSTKAADPEYLEAQAKSRKKVG